MAACTFPVAIADPAANARAILEQARPCHDDGVAVAVFPELSLTGYSIDDLFLQDVLLDGVEARDRRPRGRYDGPAAGARRRRTAGPRHPRAQLRGRRPRRSGAGRRAEVLPADLPRVLRAALVRAGRRPPRRHDPGRRGRGAVRPRPDLRRRRRARAAAARRGLRGHVGADPAERRGGAGRRDRARQPVRQPDHRRPRRGPPAAGAQRERALHRGVRLRRRRPGRVDDRPVVGRPDDDLRVRRPAGRVRAVPRRPAPYGRRRRPRPDPPGPAAAGHLRRQPAHPRRPRRRLPHRLLRAARARRRHRAAPQGRPVPVRARRGRAARPRLLRGLQHPGLRARAAAARAIGGSRRS